MTTFEARVTNDNGEVAAFIGWDLLVHREDAKSAKGKGSH
jgi:hypothetical protein